MTLFHPTNNRPCNPSTRLQVLDHIRAKRAEALEVVHGPLRVAILRRRALIHLRTNSRSWHIAGGTASAFSTLR